MSLAGELKVTITVMLVGWLAGSWSGLWTGASRHGKSTRRCRGLLAGVEWQAMGVRKEVDALRWQKEVLIYISGLNPGFQVVENQLSSSQDARLKWFVFPGDHGVILRRPSDVSVFFHNARLKRKGKKRTELDPCISRFGL